MKEKNKNHVRLQKYLASAGVASRRAAETLIQEGKVMVNGQLVTTLGSSICPGRDRIEVEGKKVLPERKVYLVFNKPPGCLCSLRDRFQRPLVRDFIPSELGRIFPVGRLDFDTEGLLLLTNDGDFCQKLIHPRFEVWKTYLADLAAPIMPAQVAALKRGVNLDEDGISAPAQVKVISPDRRRIEISIREGKKHQVKRMLQALDNRVVALKRTGVGRLRLDGLAPGKWRELTPKEIDSLIRAVKNESNLSPAQSCLRRPSKKKVG